MKILNFILATLVVSGLYATTVAFKPAENDVAKSVVFETDNFNEVGRVRDLLSDAEMKEVETLAAKGFIKIRISVKNKREGTDIDIQGGGL